VARGVARRDARRRRRCGRVLQQRRQQAAHKARHGRAQLVLHGAAEREASAYAALDGGKHLG